jgi:hydrogenase nickel incorporation protein HypA/HybF
VHELSMTTQIVDSVLEEAKKQNTKKVTEVHLVIGKLTFLGIEQVRFSYNILVEDTIMKGSKLIIEEKDGVIECISCGYKGAIPFEDDPAYHVPIPTLRCPKCGKTAKILEGNECTIRSIKMLK